MHIIDQQNIPAQEVAEAAQELSSGDVVIPKSAVMPRILFVAIMTLILGGMLLALGFVAGQMYSQQQMTEDKATDYMPAEINDVMPVDEPMYKLSEPQSPPELLDAEDAMNLDAVFAVDQLGFTLYLPTEFNELEMVLVPVETEGKEMVEFDLPVQNQSFDSEMIFYIMKYAAGVEPNMGGPVGTLLGEKDGYTYYYYPSLSMAIPPEAPEFKFYQDMAQYNMMSVVKDGFILSE